MKTKPFESIVFEDIIFGHKIEETTAPKGCALLSVKAVAVPADADLCICGENDYFGNWNTAKAVPFKYAGNCIWKGAVPAKWLTGEFKFIYRGSEIRWEECGNRTFYGLGGETIDLGNVAISPARSRIAGTAIPVFSLRSAESWGIGEFNDLKHMALWCAKTGQRIIQLLPVNDTTSTGTWTDSYPYSAISIMALNPMYLNPEKVGKLRSAKLDKELRQERERLDKLEKIDYEAVLAMKRRYFEAIYRQNGKRNMESAAFDRFFKENEEWLLPYAAFRTLADKFGTADFSQWGKYSKYTKKKVKTLFEGEDGEKMNYYIFLQYHLDLQLKEAVNEVHKSGIAIKGDIPIGIAPRSVEAWTDPELFYLDSSAGAPPDAFAADGQNWGLPTYNWDRMKEDGYAWWHRRFAKMAEYFDAYRIDHILGFFRIWEIPGCEKSGLMGHFSPALPFTAEELWQRGFHFDHNRHAEPCNGEHLDRLFLEDPHHKGLYHPRIASQFTKSYNDLPWDQKEAYNALYDDFFYHRNIGLWREKAMEKLPQLVGATRMLACAEDLGMIPSCVPEVLDALEILALEVQRMPKETWRTFGDPASYGYMTVCTTGSHDTSSLRGWWKEDGAMSQKYWNEMLHQGGAAPAELEPWMCEEILSQHLKSASMLCIFPLQDWYATEARYCGQNPDDERINVPAISPWYWRWRMPMTIEALSTDEDFCSKVRSLIKSAGR